MSEFTARYGGRNKWVDVTQRVLTRFYSDGAIVIGKGTLLNSHFGDPIKRVAKELQITLSNGQVVRISEATARSRGARVVLPRVEYED